MQRSGTNCSISPYHLAVHVAGNVNMTTPCAAMPCHERTKSTDRSALLKRMENDMFSLSGRICRANTGCRTHAQQGHGIQRPHKQQAGATQHTRCTS